MPLTPVFVLVVALLWNLSFTAESFGQGGARDRTTPGLMLETGTRTAACDALTFSEDGQRLLAAGDDKVVRIWKFTANQLIPDQTLRWSIFREQRGAIFALALSPQESAAAIGGFGVRTAAIAVLKQESGEIIHSTVLPSTATIRSLAFSPSGKRLAGGLDDGSLWSWDLKEKPGQVAPPLRFRANDRYNFVRLLGFLDEDNLVSVAEDGKVLRWNLDRRGGPEELFQFDSVRSGARLFRAALSPDHRWLAGAPRESAQSNLVEVRSLDGQRQETLRLKEEDFPHSLAFTSDSSRLAIGSITIPQQAGFYAEGEGQVTVYDLRSSPLRITSRLPVTMTPEALAFHPRGDYLAVAGGSDHEVTVWDIRNPEAVKVAEVAGPGTCLWGVGLSRDNRSLGFLTQRARQPTGANQRGAGPWRVFDLDRRDWSVQNNFQPVAPIATAAGWKVDTRGGYTWKVIDPRERSYNLPLDRGMDSLPRCYTFLTPQEHPDRPVRLAVGHYYGFSLFELVEGQAPKRVRLGVGHEGIVMALAPSADGKLLVSAGRDQTIAAWSLADWPSHPELGARFVEKDGKILVRSVDPGSPAWEASGTSPRENGLAEGDEVLLFAFNINEFLYDPHDMIDRAQRQQRRIDRVSQSAEECLEVLKNPVPGKQFYFRVKREGLTKPWLELQTTVRQRPLWRFFPMRNREWVLWRWRDYYYETSTHGDRFIGWQVSGDIGDTPQFYRADQYRKLFHRPEKIRAVLPPQWGEAPERVIFADIEAPEVRLTTVGGQKEVAVKDAGLQVNLAAAARNPDQPQPVVRVVLWVNDYLFLKLDQPPQGKVQQELAVPENVFQLGDNTLTLQAFNQAGGREEQTIRVHYTSSRRAQARTLFGLAVGINDYKKVSNLKTKTGGDLSLDYARQDAEAMQKAWKRQENTNLYRKAQIELLPEKQVTPRAILDKLAKMKDVVQPDDHFLLFLAGHGLLAEKNNPDSFVYLTPDSDGLRLKQTALTSTALLEALANLKCRKFILIDACRSGGLAGNSVRNLDPDGVGIAILAACKANQESKEIFDLKHGAFTKAVLNVLEDKEEFNRADKDRNGQVDFKELCEYVEKEVPNLIEDQNPEFGPMPMIRFFVAAKPFKP